MVSIFTKLVWLPVRTAKHERSVFLRFLIPFLNMFCFCFVEAPKAPDFIFLNLAPTAPEMCVFRGFWPPKAPAFLSLLLNFGAEGTAFF